MSWRTLLVVVIGLLMAMVLQFRPVDDVDVFWQLRTGQLMLARGQLIREDPFTFTHHGGPVPPIGWAAQGLYAGVFRWGSWRGLQLLHSLVFAGTFVTLGLSALRSGTTPFSALAAMAIGFEVALPHSSLRLQGFGVLGFAALLGLARSQWPWWRQVPLAVAVLLLWQNLHPSIAVGAVALAPVVAVAWWQWWRQGKGPLPVGPTMMLAMTVLAQFATPLGWDILTVTRVNAEVSRDWLRVSEWLPPWDPSVRGAMVTFWLALALTGLLLVLLRFRVDAADLALCGVMTLLALSAARFGLFWAVALVPVWARWIEQAKPPSMFAWRGDGIVRPGIAAVVIFSGLNSST